MTRLSADAFEATLPPLKFKPLLRHAAFPQAVSWEREADDDDDDDDDGDGADDEAGSFCADFGILKEKAARDNSPTSPSF